MKTCKIKLNTTGYGWNGENLCNCIMSVEYNDKNFTQDKLDDLYKNGTLSIDELYAIHRFDNQTAQTEHLQIIERLAEKLDMRLKRV